MTDRLFDLTGIVAVVTGGYGVLGGSIARGLSRAGARVAIVGRNADAADSAAESLRKNGTEALGLCADVVDMESLRQAAARVVGEWGEIGVLVNAAGGNVARARTDTISIFDIPIDALDEVVRLNLHGTVYPTLAFGASMARQGAGSIINISSMASVRMLSGVGGYSVAKAGVDNFTRWMAVELARKHGSGIRVNAIAPGFFVAKQNESLLRNPDGSLTDRSRRILEQTPMGRFGEPSELQGTAVWLASRASSFVTGAVIPVDGGFSVASGI